MNWKNFLEKPERKHDLKKALIFCEKMRALEIALFPPKEYVLRALETPLRKIRVVILGQDPYHGKGQATGLSFSVPAGVKTPPSLKNIFKEIYGEEPIPTSGDLSYLQDQGVFLLNCFLSVEEGSPASHRDIGWEGFTDSIIREISDQCDNVIFMLWGNFAKSKENLINSEKHLILKTTHPSPFSAHKGFFGSNHFEKCNKFLASKNMQKIIWKCISEQ